MLIERTKTGVIYALVSPFYDYKYIGQTINPKQRESVYRSVKSHNIEVCKWTWEWMEQGYKPGEGKWSNFFYILDEKVPVEKLNEREMFFIREFTRNGVQLFNKTVGGSGKKSKRIVTEKEISRHIAAANSCSFFSF